MATGQVIFHRFYFRQSFKRYDVRYVSLAALFLAAKIEETPKKCAPEPSHNRACLRVGVRNDRHGRESIDAAMLRLRSVHVTPIQAAAGN